MPTWKKPRDTDDEAVENIENKQRAHEPVHVDQAPPQTDRRPSGGSRESYTPRVFEPRDKPKPRYQELPAVDPYMPRYVEVGPPEARFVNPSGEPIRVHRSVRKQREVARFERFRAHPFRSYTDDPGFFWQIIGVIVLILLIGFGIWFAIHHPPVRFH